MMIKIFKKLPKPEKGWFSEQLEGWLKAKATAQATYKRKRTIRPSEIGQCTRKIVLMILNKVTYLPPEPKQQRTFDMGNAVHTRYLEYYIPAIGCAVTVDGEPFIERMIEDKDLWVRGAPDAVVVNKQDGLQYIFELKSIKQELFNELSNPSEEYLDQVHLYMYMTNIPRAIVFYENKNTQEIAEFNIPFDQGRMNKILAKIEAIQNFVVNFDTTGQLPARCNSQYCEGCKES